MCVYVCYPEVKAEHYNPFSAHRSAALVYQPSLHVTGVRIGGLAREGKGGLVVLLSVTRLVVDRIYDSALASGFC